MYDTVRLRSPQLTRRQVAALLQTCRKPFVSRGYPVQEGQIRGPFDTGVKLFLYLDSTPTAGATPRLITQPMPFVQVEASVHKLMFGHNLADGPCSITHSAERLVAEVEGAHSVTLPDSKQWYIRRVDVAEVYDLSRPEAVRDYFAGFRLTMGHKTRTVVKYGVDSINSPSTSITVKLYNKGAALSTHESEQIIKILGLERAERFFNLAERSLRGEVEIKAGHFRKRDGGKYLTVSDVSDTYFRNTYDAAIAQLLCIKLATPLVSSESAVNRKLHEVYGIVHGTMLMNFWWRMVSEGPAEVSRQLKNSTFYRYRKQLMDAGVNWVYTRAVPGMKCLVPEDFAPTTDDPRRVISRFEPSQLVDTVNYTVS